MYFGHGYIEKLAITNRGNSDNETISSSEFPDNVFQANPVIYLYTCHSASKYKNKQQKSIAEALYDRFGGVTMGYNGRVSYIPVAHGKMPEGGESVSRHAEVDSSLIHSYNSDGDMLYIGEMKPTYFGKY